MATGPSQVSSSLRQFRQLNGVSDTGRIIGNGSYATVKELEFCGLKCVGKQIHSILFHAAAPQDRAAMLQRFMEECELLSCLHHPCVVQFLGVYFEHGSQLPVLVMEFLHTTLSDSITRYGVLPEAISYGILRDVALGLRYLHEQSPPIIHRDLSANNVLLTPSMSGKISDLGVAKILNLTPSQMTQAPGTPCYMPPEAVIAKPTYTSKIDSYSYGVMVIHVFCGRWPFPADLFRSDSQNPDILVPMSEVDRRAEYLKDISQDHPLMGLIHQCLSNVPSRRPEASEILCQITDVTSRITTETHCNEIEKLQHWEGRVQDKQSQIESITAQKQTLQSQIESLTAQNQTLQSQIESLTAQHQSQIESQTHGQAEVEALRAAVEWLSVRSPQREGVSGQDIQLRSRPQPSPRPQLRPQSRTQPSPRPLPRPRSRTQPSPRPLPRPRSRTQPSPRPLPRSRSRTQPILLLHPQAKLHWRKVANLPMGTSRSQVVVVGERVCVGGGLIGSDDNNCLVFQYTPARARWSTLPYSPVALFGLGQLSGELLTVGGLARDGICKKVYHYKPESQEWKEFLQPMPTARVCLTVISTESALIACGGVTGMSGDNPVPCTTVEVYTTETSQWHTADPLPIPCWRMSSAIISNTGYLLGGWTTDNKPTKTVLSAPVASLIQKTTSHLQQSASAIRPDSTSSAWKTLQDTPLANSAAASMEDMLLALGGQDDQEETLPAVHVYSPATSTWIRIESGDLPEPRHSCRAVEISASKLLAIGGCSNDSDRKEITVFLGSLAI